MISACVEASPLGGISKAPKQDTLCVFTAVHLLNCVRHKHMRYVGVLPAMLAARAADLSVVGRPQPHFDQCPAALDSER